MEMKQIVHSTSNVISTRQTCGQRSGMAAGSKRRALAFYVSVRICYMFLISKYREESDLGLCMTSALAKRLLLQSADFRFLHVFGRKFRRKSALRSGILRGLRLENGSAMAKSDFSCVETHFFPGSRHCESSPNASTEVVHSPRSRSPLHFDIGNI